MLTSLAMMMAIQEQGVKYNQGEDNHREKPKKYPKEPIPQKGMKYYCFREDGTFKQYERDGAMLKEEVFFKCYALNDKNAIKKFNKFKTE